MWWFCRTLRRREQAAANSRRRSTEQQPFPARLIYIHIYQAIGDNNSFSRRGSFISAVRSGARGTQQQQQQQQQDSLPAMETQPRPGPVPTAPSVSAYISIDVHALTVFTFLQQLWMLSCRVSGTHSEETRAIRYYTDRENSSCTYRTSCLPVFVFTSNHVHPGNCCNMYVPGTS